jgi:hypothetical protein
MSLRKITPTYPCCRLPTADCEEPQGRRAGPALPRTLSNLR